MKTIARFSPVIPLSVKNNESVQLEIKESFRSPSPTDYEGLQNLPQLDGEVIKGNIHEKDPTVPLWAKEPTRPIYNASDVGAVGRDELESISILELETLWDSI